MVKSILYLDVIRQEEIHKFYDRNKSIISSQNGKKGPIFNGIYRKVRQMNLLVYDIIGEACQMHRYYYKGYPKAYHPLTFFREPKYSWQCPPEMTPVYLSYPSYHVGYKHPTVLPGTTERTSGIPSLPDRTLAPRYNKAACKLFVR